MIYVALVGIALFASNAFADRLYFQTAFWVGLGVAMAVAW